MNIKETAQKYSDYVVDIRRKLHMNPELSTQEFETSKLVQEELDKIGVPYEICGELGTGVLATVKGALPGKTILIRGDMDALPVVEEADVPFKSQHEGKMHACGHDCHTSSLLTAAHILNDIKDELHGTVKLAFQPAEETAQGAKDMIAAGAMEGVDGVYGMHVWSGVPVGTACAAAGGRMASAGQFEIWVQGKGGHGAEPANCIDAITCTTAIVNSLQTIVSREFRPMDAAVLTVGRIDAGFRWNVIADKAYIAGTTRCFDNTIAKEFPEKIERIAKGVAAAYRCTVELKYTDLVPPTVNHPEMSAIVEKAICTVMGENANFDFGPTTGGEDFAYFINAAPNQLGAICLMGGRNEAEGCCYEHHSPKFKIDEAALLNAAALYCQVADDFNKS
ncbi:MAG: amidohydrolase [Oscillospiraceae bacterium]|nr:amidohydrolase [Oscillospiraceae bacterium]